MIYNVNQGVITGTPVVSCAAPSSACGISTYTRDIPDHYHHTHYDLRPWLIKKEYTKVIIKYFITILALTSGFLSHAKKEKSSSKIPELGALKEERDYISYSGCYVKNAKGEDIIIDLVPVGKPMIRINGEVIRGSVEDPSKSLNRYSEMGQEVKATYKFDSLTIELEGKVSEVCGDNENCEGTNYDLALKIIVEGKTKKLTNLTGYCGS